MVMNLKAKMNKKAVERDAELEAGVIDPRTKELGISQEGREVDAVFGALNEDGPNYRDVGWISTLVLMIKSQIGLGILSLPSIMGTLGLVTGLICIVAIGVIMTWADYMIGETKRKYPSVYSIDDMGYLLGGRIGKEIFAVVYWLFMIFVGGAGMLSLSTSLNALSVHGACTAVFVAVAAVATALVSSIQTLGRIKLLGWAGVVSILSAVIVLVVAVGVQDRPSAAPQTGPWNKEVVLFGNPTFAQASAAVSGIVLSFAGTSVHYGILAEMRTPALYTRAMLICQIFVIVFYLIIGAVVYHYVGQYVASPALGSAGPLLKRVCYGLALPGLLATTVIFTHLAAKFIFVRTLRNSVHLSQNTVKHWIVWLGSVMGCTILAYVIASAIPVFGGLVNLIGATFGTFICIVPFGVFWLWDNWNPPVRTMRWYLMAAWSTFVVICGLFFMGAGTYGSVIDIRDSYRESGGSAAWSCADNSNST